MSEDKEITPDRLAQAVDYLHMVRGCMELRRSCAGEPYPIAREAWTRLLSACNDNPDRANNVVNAARQAMRKRRGIAA
jgi:hypothetical protein